MSESIFQNREILAPAGNAECAIAAIDGGADAVYFGLENFSARAGAANFSPGEAEELLAYARLLGVKGYVCLNTLVKEEELPGFLQAVRAAYRAGADAVLVQDIFLGKKLHELFPQLCLHLSTQAGCCNVYGAQLAKEYGFSRVVLSRETPLAEIEKISRVIETEVFVQGAICSCFSGQCYLSSFAGNHSGNRGRCKQPCRKRYLIDRAGYESFAYALSPSDLCAGERIRELAAAGVRSFKIEGRMRRREYVLSAVRYYRALLDGKKGAEEFADLQSAYNRGDYTAGLAFGQGKDFLSRKTQGHIGRKVGTVFLRGGKYFCMSSRPARQGDGFKILRFGREVGGAQFRSGERDGFYLVSSQKLNEGDEVRLTTDVALAEKKIEPRRRELHLSLEFLAGKPPVVRCDEFVFSGSAALDAAQRAPLTREELETCFRKTDSLPFRVLFDRVETENAFLPKSALNEFRRAFFAALTARLAPGREPLAEISFPARTALSPRRQTRAAIVSDAAEEAADVLVYKPADYRHISPPAARGENGEVFLYLPPFLTSAEADSLKDVLPLFDGIYCEGSWGIAFAREAKVPLFAGTGFNLTNRVAVEECFSDGAKMAVLSKEISRAEQREIARDGCYALSSGEIKVMDLCYCPFERGCSGCDRRTVYRMKDEQGRVFPLRRYIAPGGECRFELYNCAPLAAEGGAAGQLTDMTFGRSAAKRFSETPATRGHADRSML